MKQLFLLLALVCFIACQGNEAKAEQNVYDHVTLDKLKTLTFNGSNVNFTFSGVGTFNGSSDDEDVTVNGTLNGSYFTFNTSQFVKVKSYRINSDKLKLIFEFQEEMQENE